MVGKKDPITIEHLYSSSIEAIWSALTDIDEMRQWYFDNIDAFVPEVGSCSRFVVESGGRTFTHLWKVTEVVPQQRISYNWHYEEYDGDSDITFDIVPQGKGTLVRISMSITKDYPEGIPEFSVKSGIAGWNYLLKERLEPYLAQ